jgi:AbrB family looped-hinge helix DNA binding protein
MVTRMREKGQVTIPADIRESLHLSKDSLLSIGRVGNSIILSPQSPVFDSFADKVSKAAKEKGITLQSLLKDLKRIRRKES